jgi:hypothetical protein
MNDEGTPRPLVLVRAVGLLILCSVIFVAGAWAAAAGGGTVIAALVIAAGAMLVAGAFTGGMRWVILPALALAIPVAFVAAADVDFDGGIGEREYRPTSVTQIRDRYELGVGSLAVDFRSVRLPPDDPTDVTLDVGEARRTSASAPSRSSTMRAAASTSTGRSSHGHAARLPPWWSTATSEPACSRSSTLRPASRSATRTWGPATRRARPSAARRDDDVKATSGIR